MQQQKIYTNTEFYKNKLSEVDKKIEFNKLEVLTCTLRIFKSRPAKKSALINTIKTMFQDDMTDSDIEKIIFDLQKRNFIRMVENKITYL